MMALIEDEQTEATATAIEVNVSGIVGRDGERLNLVMTAADKSDRPIKGDEQFAVPLVEQINRGRDHERRAGGLVDGEDGQERLAGAGRQHDDAARPAAPPGFERLGLMRKRIATGTQRPRGRLIGAGVILVGDLLAAQMLDDGAVMQRLGAEDSGTRVLLAVRQRGETFRRGTGEDQRAALESEMNGWFVHAPI